MNIELIRQSIGNNNGRGYKYKPIKWCCDKLKDNEVINLVDEYTDDDYGELVPSVAICHTEVVSDWEDEWENDYYYRIDFCPFCGEPIKIVIVKEEDVSEIYSKLDKERKETWRKYCKTDSKRKSEELSNTVHNLDDAMNWFHNLNEYEEIEEILKKFKIPIDK